MNEQDPGSTRSAMGKLIPAKLLVKKTVGLDAPLDGPLAQRRKKSKWSNVESGFQAAPSPGSSLQPSSLSVINSDASRVLDKARALIPKYATLKINRAMSARAVQTRKQVPAASPYVDPRIKTHKVRTKVGGLRFVNKGYYIHRQHRLEKTTHHSGAVGPLIDNIHYGVENPQTLKSETLMSIRDFWSGKRFKKHSALVALSSTVVDIVETSPVCEQLMLPWDLKLLQSAQVDGPRSSVDPKELMSQLRETVVAGVATADVLGRLGVRLKLITKLVQHPTPEEGLLNIDGIINPGEFLTTKERKKMQRQRRKEREQEKRDKIQMGLAEPEPPKVKLTNLANVLSNSTNPTATEMAVRKQVADRVTAHEARNAERKLPPEKRAQKTANKWACPEETKIRVKTIIVDVANCSNKPTLFKIQRNAKDMHLTGAGLLCPGEINLIVAEGSVKAIRKYQNLIQRRIDWAHEPKLQAHRAPQIVYDGFMKTRGFKDWQIVPCSTLADVHSALSNTAYLDIIKGNRSTATDI